MKAVNKTIEALDRQILDLCEERIHKTLELTRKEKDLLVRLKGPQLQGKHILQNKPWTQEIFTHLFNEALRTQKTTVAFLGPEATNSHEAAKEIFGERGIYLPQATIREIFREVESGKAAFGVVPIENSMEGTIHLSLDLLRDTPLTIYGEKTIPIHHNLMGYGTLKTIREIYSHPQVLGQCRNWVAAHLPQAKMFEYMSSAAAVAMIKKSRTKAAIGTKLASELYHCPVIEENIQDSRTNKTRFFILSYEHQKPSQSNKTSIVFLCQDKPGALVEALKVFKKYRINLTKIESRPSKRENWEYSFFVDFIGHTEDEVVKKALHELKRSTFHIKILGSYPIG